MRILSATLGVLGGLVGLIYCYGFLLLGMLMLGAATPAVQRVFFYALLALIIASVLGLVGGLLHPRRPTARWMLGLSGAMWLAVPIFLAVVRLLDAEHPYGLVEALKFVGILALPCLLPFASLAAALRVAPTAAAARP